VGGEAGSRGRASSNFGPEVGFNLVSGVLATSPRFFSRVKLQSVRRVLRDRFQPGATQPGFSISNSTYVLTENQVVERDSVRSYRHLFARPAVKFPFIAEHSQEYPITLLCQTLDASESGYYAWKHREASRHAREDARLAADIQQIYQDYRQVYGSPRIHAVLQERGVKTSRKRVLRLMQQLGLSAQVKRSRKPTTQSDPQARFAPNTLNREFAAEQPNTRWITDTKAVETAEGWLYLAAIVDLFSRMVIGWAMAATEDGALVELALRMAVARRHPEAGLLHHSDRGTECTCERSQAA